MTRRAGGGRWPTATAISTLSPMIAVPCGWRRQIMASQEPCSGRTNGMCRRHGHGAGPLSMRPPQSQPPQSRHRAGSARWLSPAMTFWWPSTARRRTGLMACCALIWLVAVHRKHCCFLRVLRRMSPISRPIPAAGCGCSIGGMACVRRPCSIWISEWHLSPVLPPLTCRRCSNRSAVSLEPSPSQHRSQAWPCRL